MNPVPNDPHREHFAARLARLSPRASSLDATETFYKAGFAAGHAAASQGSKQQRFVLIAAAVALFLICSFSSYKWGNQVGYAMANSERFQRIDLANDKKPTTTPADYSRHIYEEDASIALNNAIVPSQAYFTSMPWAIFFSDDGNEIQQSMIQQVHRYASEVSLLANDGQFDKRHQTAQVEHESITQQSNNHASTFSTRSRINDLRQLVETY